MPESRIVEAVGVARSHQGPPALGKLIEAAMVDAIHKGMADRLALDSDELRDRMQAARQQVKEKWRADENQASLDLSNL